MVTVESFNELVGKDVFTDKGLYCGKVTDLELDVDKFRVRGIVIDVVRGSHLASIVGNKRGIIVPYHLVESIGDVVIIRSFSPTMSESVSTE